MRTCSFCFLVVFLPLPLLTGCPAEPGTENETGTDSGPGIPGCECIVDEDDENPPDVPSGPTCGESTCPEVSASCPGECDSESFEVSDPAALECALTALRDRTPGLLTWSTSENAGQFEDSAYILIHEDGTAVTRTYGWQDLSYVVSDATLGPLRDAAFYTTCLEAETDFQRFSCLRAELSGTDVCDEGWSYDEL